MMQRTKILHIFFSLNASIVFSFLQVKAVGGNRCTLDYVDCSHCLATADCSWCSDEAFSNESRRCDKYDNLIMKNCNKNNIINPQTITTIKKNLPVGSTTKQMKNTIQISPQEVDLQLRLNKPATFELKYYLAPRYPLDLYYLMDLTYSMKEHKERVVELADNLANSMQNITENFRLGFGSFIDKVVMPYVDMVPDRLKNPCPDTVCERPYGFINHLPLVDDTAKFKNKVAGASLSANLDNAEGGFDAIMQTIVCKDQINWRTYSRKIILFATDSMFHYAGDGKLGGIVKPNDELCHLNSAGFYTESLHQDYPALSQIKKVAEANGINIFFAVPEGRIDLYNRLSTFINGSSAGVLSEDSSNIVQLIETQYKDINSKISLIDDSKSPIVIKYYSKCLNVSNELRSDCTDLEVGDSVTFEVKVDMTSCPQNKSEWKKSVIISAVGLPDKVKLNLELICGCDCEKPENGINSSPKCSNNGTYSCGICKCNANRFGPNCQCPWDDATNQEYEVLCKSDEQICSNRGQCVCGKCDCKVPEGADEKIYGKFCECDTFSCYKDNKNLVCSGNGKCCSGSCVCNNGWTGDNCDCTEETSTCIAPGGNIGVPEQICSGHGKCKCGNCQCFKDNNARYFGRYCGESSIEGKCAEFQPCSQCQAFQTGSLGQDDCKNCSLGIVVVDALANSLEERTCTFKDFEDNCFFHFQYSYDSEGNPVIRVRKDKDCPKELDVLRIVLGVIGGILGIGVVAVLIYKLVLYCKDLRDYKAFEREVEELKQSNKASINPLFKAATSNFQNPLFAKQD